MSATERTDRDASRRTGAAQSDGAKPSVLEERPRYRFDGDHVWDGSRRSDLGSRTSSRALARFILAWLVVALVASGVIMMIVELLDDLS